MKEKLIGIQLGLDNLLVRMAIFGILAIVIPNAIIDFYYKYLDTREYYHIESPVKVVDSTSVKCGTMTLIFTRNSQILSDATANKELTLVHNGSDVYKTTSSLVLNPTNGYEDVPSIVDIPCTIPEGEYYWNGVVSYDVHGVDKHEAWTSENFTLKH